MKQRLAAILEADVVGFSRLMTSDERATVQALDAARTTFRREIEARSGRVIDMAGDSVLAVFDTATGAVSTAIAVQSAFEAANAGVPEARRMRFRIGVHLGDIFEKPDGTVYGDGVNVAARLQAVADPGGIMVSQAVRGAVQNRVPAQFEDRGVPVMKNIADPVQAYAVVQGLTQPAADGGPRLALPDKPSVAVLPFTNMSGDAEQEYFADGMAEEITNALSHCSSLFVIARNSSFGYKGRAVPPRQIGQELGVRYVLQGSVRRSAQRLRFTAQLIDTTSGINIWSDRFDGVMGDVLELQDRITESVVAAIEPQLQLAEIERLKHKPVANLDAYDLLLRAQKLEYECTDHSLRQALELLQKALYIDPRYAAAMALSAYCYAERRNLGWAEDLEAEAAKGVGLARNALDLANDDANVLWMVAYATWRLAGDMPQARELAYRSLLLNPNSAIAMALAGWIESNLANPSKALDLLRRAERLSPRDPRGWFIVSGLAFTHLACGQYEEAVSVARKALLQNPRFAVRRVLAAALGKLGREAEAAAEVKELLKIDPKLSVSDLRTRLMFMDAKIWENYADGLRRAGLRE
jgi:adenylate cyclase